MAKIVYGKHNRVVVEDTSIFSDGSGTEWVHFKIANAFAVFALTKNNRVILTKQYRHPIKKIIVDLPAGGHTWYEKPEQTTLRELDKEALLDCWHAQM